MSGNLDLESNDVKQFPDMVQILYMFMDKEFCVQVSDLWEDYAESWRHSAVCDENIGSFLHVLRRGFRVVCI